MKIIIDFVSKALAVLFVVYVAGFIYVTMALAQGADGSDTLSNHYRNLIALFQ